MLIDFLERIFPDKGSTPNKFTIGMGMKIRIARDEANLSQTELSRMIYRHQPALSDMENGKLEVDTSALTYLAAALNKPLTFFFPDWITKKLQPESNNPYESELILQARRLGDEDLKRLIVQARALAEME